MLNRFSIKAERIQQNVKIDVNHENTDVIQFIVYD
ncbi:hypothetical protein VIMY103929_09880 [Vibrio mytili]